MKNLITSFLILFLGLNLKAATNLPFFYIGPMAATTTTVNINAQGAVMPTAFGDTPTLFALTGASMAAGKKLVIDRRGGFAFLPNQADNTGTGILAAFVTSTGSIIPPHSESSVIVRTDGTFVAELGGVIVTIPNGATGIILGPFDTHPFDNEDANGDFRALISSPVLEEMLITQNNIENPDYNSDGKVDVRLLDAFSVSYDLVSTLNTDSAGFKMTDLDTSSTHFVDASAPNASGTVTFNVDFEKLKQKGRSINFLKDVQFSFEYAAKKVKTDTVNIINPVLKIFQAENAGEDPVELTEDNPESLYLIKPEEMARFVVETGVPNMPVTSSGLIIAFADNSGGGGNPLPNPKLGTTITIPPTQNTTDSEGKLYFETNFDYDLFGNHEANVVVFIEEPVQRSIVQFFEKDFLFRVLNVEHKIYQVIENPNLEELESPRTDKVIDLVAGKNADIVVKLVGQGGARRDISQSTIKIGDSTEVYKPKNTVSDLNGEVVFEIDPVPEILNQEIDLEIHIKDTQGETLGMGQSKVKIWKTKPIRIGFMPVSGCNGNANECFSASSFFNANQVANLGRVFMKSTFPVADKDLDTSFVVPEHAYASFTPIELQSQFRCRSTGTKVDFNIDYNYLVKSAEYYGQNYGNFDHFVAVVSDEYFTRHHKCVYENARGFAVPNPKEYTVAVYISYNYPIALPHEIGHARSLGHNFMPANGYANEDLGLGWGIKRGLVNNKINLMLGNSFPILGVTPNYWIEKNDYLRLFQSSKLIQNTLRSVKESIPAVYVSGNIENDSSFVTRSVSLISLDSFTGLLDTDYEVRLKNINKEIINSYDVQSSKASEGDETYLIFKIPITIDSIFIEVVNKLNNHTVGEVVIPTELIKEEIRYLPDHAILHRNRSIKREIIEKVMKAEEFIQLGSMDTAIDVLTKNVSSIVEKNLLNPEFKKRLLDTNKESIKNIIKTVSIRMLSNIELPNNLENSFIKMDISNHITAENRSHIEINLKKTTVDPNYLVITRAWFDGIENRTLFTQGSYFSYSPRLTDGKHFWLVQAYLVSKKEQSRHANLIWHQRQKKQKTEAELRLETDPEKKQKLISQINAIDTIISTLDAQFHDSLLAIGDSVFMKFEID